MNEEREEQIREPQADAGRSDSQEQVEEPEADGGRYEAQAASSAPAAPARERVSETQPSHDDREAIDERAATTKTQPMARLEGDRPRPTDSEGSEALRADSKLKDFSSRWDEIQAGFVDDPRRTVEQADHLVAEVIDQLSKIFSDERAKLEAQWSRGGKVETEDLRIAMQRYRDFFRTLVGR